MSSNFLDMSGYAVYVWGSYGVTLLVFGWNVLAPQLGRREVLRRLREAAAEPGSGA